MPRIDGLNDKAAAICQLIRERQKELQIDFIPLSSGALVIDFGTDRIGTMEAGIELSRICLADMANVSLDENSFSLATMKLDSIRVETLEPLQACIGAQYAGWPFSTAQMFSMCSGPARLKRGLEEILTQYSLSTTDQKAVGIFETNQIPTVDDVAEFAIECHCEPKEVTICLARTCSLPGMTQVVSRSVETAMHKLFELGFDLRKVKKGVGTAPIPPIAKDDYIAMGWTNDAILYGGEVHLWLEDVEDLDSFVDKVPSSSSEQFGRPFRDIFAEFDRDFYKIDRLLFSPAKITLSCLNSGATATAGSIRTDLIEASFNSGE